MNKSSNILIINDKKINKLKIFFFQFTVFYSKKSEFLSENSVFYSVFT